MSRGLNQRRATPAEVFRVDTSAEPIREGAAGILPDGPELEALLKLCGTIPL
jgi:hypothetical protein